VPHARKEPVVWVIDKQQWPRALLRAELIQRGCDVVGYQEIADALVALNHPAVTPPQVIVLELCGQRPERHILAALHHAGIPIIGLAGAIEANDPIVHEFRWAALLRRPLTIGAVADQVQDVLNRSDNRPAR